MNGLKVFIGIGISLCLVSSVFAEVQVSSTLNKRTARVGEEIHMKVKVSGAKGNIQAPRLPNFKGFDSFYTGRASHLTFINNKSSSSIEFSYVLIPREEGSFKLDPIEVYVSNDRYVTAPEDIQVTGQLSQQGAYTRQNQPAPFPTSNRGSSNAPPPAQAPVRNEPPPSFQPSDDNIFVRAWVDKTSVYQNEQVLLNYSLYTRYDTRYEGFETEPQVSGFWIEEFPPEQEVRRETVRLNGKRYVKADIKKMALFPTAAAEYTIQPGTLKVSVRKEQQQSSVFDEFFNDSFFSGGGFFARRENRLLKPPPILINVKPLPEAGKPKSFQGAVGNYRLTASVDKTAVKQNEPVTLKLVIEGEGNVETLNKPIVPELPEFKIYDADSSTQLFKTGNVVGGRKTFEIVFIPIEAGQLKIPRIEFSFFNPISANYQQLSSQPFQLDVKPSKQDFKLPKNLSVQDVFKEEITAESKDIHFIKEKMPDPTSRALGQFAFQGLAGAGILSTFLVLFALWRERQERIYAKDNSLKRRRYAKSQAEAGIRRLKKVAKQGDAGKYFDEFEKVLTQYLSDKFNLSAYGVTRMDLENHIAQKFGSEDKLNQDLRDFYQLCDESRFGKAEIPSELKNKAMGLLKHTISRVEKLK